MFSNCRQVFTVKYGEILEFNYFINNYNSYDFIINIINSMKMVLIINSISKFVI